MVEPLSREVCIKAGSAADCSARAPGALLSASDIENDRPVSDEDIRCSLGVGEAAVAKVAVINRYEQKTKRDMSLST